MLTNHKADAQQIKGVFGNRLPLVLNGEPLEGAMRTVPLPIFIHAHSNKWEVVKMFVLRNDFNQR